MHINKDNVRSLAQKCYFGLPHDKGIVEIGHEDTPLQIQHADRRQTLKMKNAAPVPDGTLRIIQWSQKARFVLKQTGNLFLIPKMIAAGDDIDPTRKNLLG